MIWDMIKIRKIGLFAKRHRPKPADSNSGKIQPDKESHFVSQ